MSRRNGAVMRKLRPEPKPEPRFHVAISIPCMDTVQSGFMYDLAKLTAYSGVVLVAKDIATMRINMLSSSILPCSRNDLAAEAIQCGATHMLCIDSDMRFPKDALVRLLKHDKDIVGINYSTRKVPPAYVGYKTKGQNGAPHVRLVTDETTSGLEQVDALGFGLILINLRVFRGLAYPAFETTYTKELGWTGEDVDFCLKAKANGSEVWVDHDLSKECAHVGTMEYKLEMVAATKDMDPGLITPEVRDEHPLMPRLVEA